MDTKRGIVEVWHAALNAGDVERLVELSDPEVELAGPRGTVRGAEVLCEWVDRANIRLEPKRVFQEGDTVVVEEEAEWRSPETGEVVGGGTVASVFVVAGGLAASVARHDDLATALEAAGIETLDPQLLQSFFVRYGEALAAGDLGAISGCYAVPGLVLSDEGSVPIATRAEVEAAFDGAADRYRAQGLVDIRHTLVASEAISERLVSADVRWDSLDEQGRSAQQNGYRYVLRLAEDEGPLIQVVIAIPEL